MLNKKIGVIGIPGKWSTEVLADRLEHASGFRLVIDMAKVVFDVRTHALFFEGHNLCELDGIVVKKITQDYDRHMWDRIELLRVAEDAGVRIFSPCSAILQLVNRLGCTVTLSKHAIPMPKTLVTENKDEALRFVLDCGQVVLKPMFSTKARGMTLLDASHSPIDTIQSQLNDFHTRNPMLYIQQKALLQGQDLGMVFVGGNYLCTYARVSSKDSWNTTIESGGKYAFFEPEPSLIELGKKAQAPFGLDFTTVDIALTDDGPIVFEVSAFGGFKGALEGAKVDAAAAYSEHIFTSLERLQ